VYLNSGFCEGARAPLLTYAAYRQSWHTGTMDPHQSRYGLYPGFTCRGVCCNSNNAQQQYSFAPSHQNNALDHPYHGLSHQYNAPSHPHNQHTAYHPQVSPPSVSAVHFNNRYWPVSRPGAKSTHTTSSATSGGVGEDGAFLMGSFGLPMGD
jgi:hypothetical protein